MSRPVYSSFDDRVPEYPRCDDPVWEEMTEEDWEDFYNDRYHEGFGGD